MKNVPDNLSLSIRADQLFPGSVNFQLKWLRAVIYLRDFSKTGWNIDRFVERKLLK